MYKKSFLQPILFGLFTILLVASCDKDFNEFGTNIVGDDHFGFERYTDATVKSYNQKLSEIASNNLPVNPLGFYTNPAFGTTQANFVTQAELATLNPTFNNTDPDLYDTDPTVLDSVVMEIPYFKKFVETTTVSDVTVSTYTLDSIYGVKPYDQTTATLNSKFKLSVYQSNYYLRDLDPDQSLVQQQLYYTGQNQDNVIDNNKIPVLLNDAPLTNPPTGEEGVHNLDGHENESFYFDNREHKTIAYETDGVTRVSPDPRSVPSMRIHLNKTVFDNLFLHAPTGKLADNVTFKNYFRGLYFKVENGNPGNMAMINFKGGKITLYYNEDLKKTTLVHNSDGTTTTVITYTRPNKTLVLNLSGNSISLLKNSNENPNYLTATNNPTQEASQLYLKGGEGSMAVIDLFGAVDTKGYTRNTNFNANLPVSLTNPKFLLNPSYNPSLPVSDTNPKYMNTGANGVPDEIDNMKANEWLINEANLVFNINKTSLTGTTVDPDGLVVEPNRIYLYDLTNKKAIIDYTYDISTNGSLPKQNKFIFGGILLNDDGTPTKQIKNANNVISNKGSKYKIRLTNYLRNLINKDSTNVRLGLSVTESINNVTLSKLKTPNTTVDRAPAMSVISQTGTILYGTNIPSGDTDYSKKIQLEIYYTKPN